MTGNQLEPVFLKQVFEIIRIIHPDLRKTAIGAAIPCDLDGLERRRRFGAAQHRRRLDIPRKANNFL
jgi:hypothetical protein